MRAVAPESEPQRTAEIRWFVEETCHDKWDQLVSERRPVCFRLFSVGRRLRQRIDVEFWYDWGVYYEPDDDNLISALFTTVPGVRWERFVYHRTLDQRAIVIIDPDDDTPVARVELRKYHGRPVRPESVRAGRYGENVVCLEDLQAERARRRDAEAAAEDV